MAVSLQSYPILARYAILSASTITTVPTLTVTQGYYGNPPGTYSGTIVGLPNSADATVAQTQLTSLVNALRALTPTSGTAGTSLTPGVYSGADPNYSSAVTLTGAGTYVIISSSTITIGTGTTFSLAGGATIANTNIFWVAASAVNFTGASTATQFYGTVIAQSSVTLANSTITMNGPVYAQTAAVNFNGTGPASVIGQVTGTLIQVVCYAKGTQILTPDGCVPIESLKKNCMVMTRADIEGPNYVARQVIAKPIRWIGNFTIDTQSAVSMPVCIHKDAFGPSMPFQDLFVSPGHRMLMGGKIVPAHKLVNGTTVTQDYPYNEVTYYHFQVDGHAGILANGVLSESLAPESDVAKTFKKEVKNDVKPISWLRVM